MKTRNQRGAVMVLSLGLMAFVATLGAAFLIRSLNEDQLGQREATRQSAFYLAEAGIDRASLNLRTPTDATDDILNAALPTGAYQITAQAALDATHYQVTARGTSGTTLRTIEAVYLLTPQSVFQYALFGDRKVEVEGNATSDSYNSSLGPYQDDPNQPGYNKGQNGDIGTNATAATETTGVKVDGSIFVDGQVIVGPGVANPTSVVSGYNPLFITGGTTPPSDNQDVISPPAAFPMPPVTLNGQAFTTNPFTAVLGDGDGDCADATVTGNTTTTLSPTGGLNGTGQYCYRNLTIQGGGTLTSTGTGTVNVYLTGTLIARGNSTVGYAPNPGRMLFQMTAGSQATLEEGTITGSTAFYGGLYGPLATIKISGNAEVYGSIIAKDVKLEGSAELHYDESLQNNTTIGNLYKRTLVSWRDLN